MNSKNREQLLLAESYLMNAAGILDALKLNNTVCSYTLLDKWHSQISRAASGMRSCVALSEEKCDAKT